MTDPEPVVPDHAVRFHDNLIPLLEPVEDVSPHPENPREGDVEVITESIRANGCYRPIHAQRSTGHILAGNHTYEALAELGATRVPVVWLDVDDTTAARILLVDNRSADLAAYDDRQLAALLEQVKGATPDGLDGTGYDDDDLDALLLVLARDESPEPSDGEDDTGDVDDRGDWPWVKVQIDPDTFGRFTKLPGDDDGERLVGLLDRVGAGHGYGDDEE